MSYESRLYIGREASLRLPGEPKWLMVDVMFNMKAMYYKPWKQLLKENPPPNKAEWFVFADDGNTEITKDPYDSYLAELPFEDTLKALRAINRKKDNGWYMTKAVQSHLEALDPGFVILHYGY